MSVSNEERKKYVSLYLPEAMADKLEAIKDGAEQGEIIKKYIDDCRKDLKTSAECMEDDVLAFRGMMSMARAKFAEAKKEHLSATCEVWGAIDEEMPSLTSKVKSMTLSLRPIKTELQGLIKLANDLDSHSIGRLCEVVRTLSTMMDDPRSVKTLKLVAKVVGAGDDK